MSKIYEKVQCWVVRDSEGHPWIEDHDGHYGTREDAVVEIDDFREDEGDVTDEELATGAENLPVGRREQWIEHGRKRRTLLASLTAIQLSGACYQVRCDGPDCGDEPYSDEFSHVHFSDAEPFDPDHFVYVTRDGKDYCDDCRNVGICGECDGPMGDDGNVDERMCAKCWAEDQDAPGPLDAPLIPAVTS